MTPVYSFMDFILKPEELSLYHKKNRLELGLKGYKLLVTLIENQGKIVPKDELIEAAWNKQIVTDGTLSKQIERIRSVLSANHPEIDFIETVRGIGYKFLIQVREIKDRKPMLRKWQKVMASVSIIPLVIFLYFYPFANNHSDTPEEQIIPFNIAVIPSAQGDDYLRVGASGYLSALLDKNPGIYSVSPQSSWSSEKNRDKLAIDIKDQKQLDYVLLVDITEENDGLKTANLKLKNFNDKDDNFIVKASEYKHLFTQINSWLRRELKLDASTINNYNSNLSDDSFAVESYLRGLKESHLRNYSRAIDYFKTALNQDEQFDLARIRIAEAQILSSDYDSARAILQVLSSKGIQDEELKLWIETLNSNVLVYTEQSNTALPAINNALWISKRLKNTRISEKLLYLKATVFLQNGDYQNAIESTLEQKNLLAYNIKEKARISRVDNNLGYLYYYTKDYINAELHIKQALTEFEKQNNIPALFSSYNILASIYHQLALFDKEKLLLKKAEALLPLVENNRLILAYYETKAYFEIESGLHTQLSETIKNIENLSVLLKSKEPLILAIGAELELGNKIPDNSIINKNYIPFKNLADEINTNLPVLRTQILLKLIQSDIIINNINQAKSLLSELKQLPESQKNNLSDEIQVINSQILLVENHSVAHKELHTLLNQMLDKKLYLTALKVAQILIVDYLKEDNHEIISNILNQLNIITKLPYPFPRYKAIITAKSNDYFKAAQLMQKMKQTSNEWWTTEDQLLLDDYLTKIK